LVLNAPWGFDARTVATPAMLLYGRTDDIVPAGHMEFYRRTLPNIAAIHLSDDDHIATVVNNKQRIIDWLRRA
jgi:poly(3-hydroxyalkanoate) synthetase